MLCYVSLLRTAALGLLCEKYRCYSCQILMKLEFLDRFFKNTQKSNFTKIPPVGVKLYHADRRTDSHDAVNSCFSQFCKCTVQWTIY